MSKSKTRHRKTSNARKTSSIQAVPRAKIRQTQYSPVFFIALAATIVSTIGFIGVVASVMAGS